MFIWLHIKCKDESQPTGRHQPYQFVHMSLVKPGLHTIVSFSVVSSPSANLSQPLIDTSLFPTVQVCFLPLGAI